MSLFVASFNLIWGSSALIGNQKEDGISPARSFESLNSICGAFYQWIQNTALSALGVRQIVAAVPSSERRAILATSSPLHRENVPLSRYETNQSANSSSISGISTMGSGGRSNSKRIGRSDASSDDEEEWTMVVIELLLRIGIACCVAYLGTWLAQRLSSSLLDDVHGQHPDDRMSKDALHARLTKILQKRADEQYYHELELLQDGQDEDATGISSTASPLNILSSRFSTKTVPPPPKVVLPPLTTYERQMAEDLIDPDDIDDSFSDIGGLDDLKHEIYELAIVPLLRPDLYRGSKLVQPTKGILLYGKPGTGKTMLAKSLAKEAHAIFLPLQLSRILNKWVGESNKLIAACFSLAHKLQPAILFIDELDTFLKANNQETQYLDAIKAEFLTLWDGVSTSQQSQVLVLGATNKPQTIDVAIQRRMPRTFEVPLPDLSGRLHILQILFRNEQVDETVGRLLPDLAKNTAGYSGSDLNELARAAAMIRIQERTHEFAKRRVSSKVGETSDHGRGKMTKEKENMMESSVTEIDDENDENDTEPSAATSRTNAAGTRPMVKEKNEPPLRAITGADLVKAFQKVRRTGADTQAYGRAQAQAQHEQEMADRRALYNSTKSNGGSRPDENGGKSDTDDKTERNGGVNLNNFEIDENAIMALGLLLRSVSATFNGGSATPKRKLSRADVFAPDDGSQNASEPELESGDDIPEL
jgi:ATPase family AAA domain-containing protein 1